METEKEPAPNAHQFHHFLRGKLHAAISNCQFACEALLHNGTQADTTTRVLQILRKQHTQLEAILKLESALMACYVQLEEQKRECQNDV